MSVPLAKRKDGIGQRSVARQGKDLMLEVAQQGIVLSRHQNTRDGNVVQQQLEPGEVGTL